MFWEIYLWEKECLGQIGYSITYMIMMQECHWSSTNRRAGKVKRKTEKVVKKSGHYGMGWRRAKKVVSESPGLVDFAIRLVIFVLNLPDGQVLFLGEIQITEGL